MADENALANAGSNALDVFVTILPCFFTICIAKKVATSRRISDVGLRLLVEFAVVVVPIVLITTVLSEHKNLVLVASALAFLASNAPNVRALADVWDTRVQHKKEWLCISYSRALISLMTIHCILAVDFNVFARYMGKTDRYGFSLMDTGVGLFVFANGLVPAKISKYGLLKSFENNIRPCLFLLILGYARYAILDGINYTQPVNEYGLHWNFFITLALTKLFGIFFLHVFKEHNSLFCGVGLMALHEFLVQYRLGKWVFRYAARTNFYDANREGISSMMGFVALFLISNYVGQVIRDRYDRKTEGNILAILGALAGVLWGGTFTLSLFFEASRCLANTVYCVFILAIGVTMLALFYLHELSEILLKNTKEKSADAGLPLILNAVNKNGLLFFLIGNVATGLINILFKTVQMNTASSLLVILLYMIFVSTIIVGWEQKRTS